MIPSVERGADKWVWVYQRLGRYRGELFHFSLLLITAAFVVLTFLVKTKPNFAIDLQISRGLQSINIPLFGGLMTALSGAGFGPQSVIITVLIGLLIYSIGLQWEALMSIFTAVFSAVVNMLLKELIQRPSPAPDLVNVFAPINSYSFPSGHVMFYLGFFGFIGFLAFSLLKPSFKRSLLLVLLWVQVTLIGVSRIYVGEQGCMIQVDMRQNGDMIDSEIAMTAGEFRKRISCMMRNVFTWGSMGTGVKGTGLSFAC